MAEAETFPEFVRVHGPGLLRTAWMLTGDAHLAEDLLQTALVRTWPHWSRIADGSPTAYVRQVMVRTYGAWWRRKWSGEVPTGELPERAGSDEMAEVDDREVLRRALDTLPRKQRLAVVLRHYEDLSEADTAQMLGCSVGTVKSQAAKGLAKLRAVLTPADVREGEVSDADA